MHASLLLDDPVSDQLHALTALVEQVRGEVGQLRLENAQLRQQVSELKCDVGYWKSRQLKAERFGKQSEKQSSTDRSNDLEDPSATPKNKKKRGQQPGLAIGDPNRRIPKQSTRSYKIPREKLHPVGEYLRHDLRCLGEVI